MAKPGTALEDTSCPYRGEMPSAWRADIGLVDPIVEHISGRDTPLETSRLVTSVWLRQLAAQARPPSGLAAALAREDLKQTEGGSYSAEEARQALGGMSKEAVLQRYRNGRLVGWREVRQNAVRFPVWQFHDGRNLPGLEPVLEILNESEAVDDWGRFLFFMNRRAELKNERRLDLLRRGELEPVKRAAPAFVE